MMRVFTGLPASGRWLAFSLAALGIVRGLAGQTDTLSVSVGQEFVVVDGGTATRHLPFLASFNQRQIVTFSQHPDAVLFPTTDGMVVSSDGGQTWPDYIQSQNFYLSGMARLPDGSLLAMSYITQRASATDISAYYWTSTDNGASWTAHVGNVHLILGQVARSANWGGFEFHRSILAMPDGSLRATMYGNYVGDSKFRSIWVRSDDGGANWTVVSSIAYSPTVGSEGYCEPVAIRAADGSLLVVMRTGSTSYPLYQARSTDGGLTWSQPTTLPGMDPTQTLSVDPDLTLMANGTLVLSYGRPTVNLLFSLDGSGYSWGWRTLPGFSASASCYTGVREVSPNRLLLVTDNGTRTAILGKYVDVVRASPQGDTSPHTVNLSSRGLVGIGGQVLVAGFTIDGNGPASVLLRAVGPTLLSYGVNGVLVHPLLTLYDKDSAVIATVTGWGIAPTPGRSSVPSFLQPATADLFSRLYAFALPDGSSDSAMVVTLPPGSYTAQVSGADGGTGVALAEIYEMR